MISAFRPLRRRPSRLALSGIGLVLASALSCGREITAPGGASAGAVSLRPVFADLRLAGQHAPVSVSGLVEFVRVRIVLLRANGDTAVNRVVEFPADSQSISLTIPVVLSSGAPAEGETFAAALRFVNAAGDTVFRGGPIAVQARPLGATPADPPAIPITYTGPGASAASLTLSADTVSGRRGETKTLTATVRDASGAVLSNVPIAYSSLDTTMATVGLTNGTVSFTGIRGQTRVVAQTLTGQADTALVLVFPVPTALAFAPEAIGQQTRQRDPFPTPAAVKVTAADGLPVAGTIIDFTVTRGKGTVSQAKDTTDANGIASVIWTAGDSVGTGELSARVSGGTLTATLTGVQLSAGPTSLRFVAQPTNVVAQDTMPALSVVVLDATEDTVRAFTGPVRLALAGGRAGATLTGAVKVDAVAGVARFTDLAVDRDGTGYTLITSLDSSFAVPAVTSTAFDVTPRPIGSIALLSGGGQTATFGTAFANPVIFQVRGLTGEAIRDVIVTFAATGGGSLSQAQDTSDALGQVSVLWTAGTTAGEVTLTATALGSSISGSAVNRQGSSTPADLEFLSQPIGIVAGDTLPPIRVRVLNGLGLPITDYVGSAIIGLNGGTTGAVLLNNGSEVAFSGGIAEFRGLSVDRAGTGYRLKVQVTSTSVVALSDSAFTVTAAGPSALQIVSGNFQSAIAGAALADSVVYRVVNRFGEGVLGQTVTFAVTGGGSLSATSAVTDSAGRAAVRWTTGLTGDQRLTATVDTLTATAVAYIPQGLAPVSGAGQKVFHGDTASAPIVFRVVQANGSGLRGIPVTFSATEGGGTLTPVNVVSDSLGNVQTKWTAGSAYNGEVAIKAQIPGMASAFSIAVVTQGTRHVAALRYRTQPTAIVAGDTLPTIVIAALNGLGDTATTFTGSVRLTLSGGPSEARLLGTTTVNAVAGIARFPGLTVDLAATAYQLVATLPGDTTFVIQSSEAFAVSAAPAATLTLVSGGGQMVPEGAVLPDSIVVQAKDRFGGGVAGATVGFAVIQGGGTVSASTRPTDGLGRAAIRWTAGTEGSQRLAVTMPGLDTVFVSATALASSGAPILFFSTDAVVPAPLGRETPVRLFVSNPTPAPVPVTLTMSVPGIARWSTASATIPIGGTALDLRVIGEALGTVRAIAASEVGTDSLTLIVDSASVRLPSTFVQAFVSDTVRTRIILDAPAPAGGATFLVTSSDATRVRVAAGRGTGVLEAEPPPCFFCESATEEVAIVGTPGVSATVLIAEGETIGQLVLIPVDSTHPGPDVSVRVVSTAYRDQTVTVRAWAPRFDPVYTRADYPTIGVGQYTSGWIALVGYEVSLRRDLPVRLRPLAAADSAIVKVLDTLVTIPRGVTGQPIARMVEGLAPGTGRLLVSAPGFRPETLTVTVEAAAIRTLFSGSSTVELRQGSEYTELIYFGSTRREPTRLRITAEDSSVVGTPGSLDVPGSATAVEVPLRPKQVGSTTVTFAADGYASRTVTYTVSASDFMLYAASSVRLGLTGEIELYRGSSGPQLDASEWTVTSSAPEIVRVLTPTVVFPAGYTSKIAAQLEGRAIGSATITFTGAGRTLEEVVTVAPGALFIYNAGVIFEADSAEREIMVLTVSGRPFADRVEGRLESNNPSVIEVTDPILRFLPDSNYAIARVRTIGAVPPETPVLLTATAPGQESSSAAVAPRPASLHVMRDDFGYGFTTPVSSPIVIGQGLAVPIFVQRWTPTTVALPLTFTRQGTAAVSVTELAPAIAVGAEAQLVRVRGGSVLGRDTLIVSTSGLRPDSVEVVVVPTRLAIEIAQSTLGVEQRAEVTAWTAAEYPGGALVPQRVADSTWVRVFSLDTTIVRVERDSILLVPGADGAVRLGQVRGIAPGIARLRAVRMGTSDTLARLDLQVEPPYLSRGFFDADVILGMQQQTETGELYLERSHVSRRGLWVHLRSSAPRLVSVPDSVLIPGDSSWVSFVVTSGDSVGGVTITASADRHRGLAFPVTVTRNRLLPIIEGTYGELDAVGTGVDTRVELVTLTGAPTWGGFDYLRSTGEVGLYEFGVEGYLRPTRVPIPVRLQSADPSVLSVLRDTTTIPAGTRGVRVPALRGLTPGAATVTLDDRRTGQFVAALPSAVTMQVMRSRLRFRRMNPVIQVPFLGRITETDLIVESVSSIDTVVAQVRVLPTTIASGAVTGIGVSADAAPTATLSLTPQSAYASDEDYGYCFYSDCRPKARLVLTGLALGTHAIVAEAPGHLPDTIRLEVTKPILRGVGLSPTLRTGDSVQVTIGFTASTGVPMTLHEPVTFSVSAGAVVVTTVGGVTTNAVTAPAGATEVRFWVKGAATGTTTVTVGAPNFSPFSASVTVRAP